MTSTSPLKNVPFNNINLSGLQKKYGMPKQVKDQSRFFPDKIADTGKDPKGSYSGFIKNDIFKPLSRNLNELPNFVKPYRYYEPIRLNQNEINNVDQKWALNTNKKCTSPDQIPKKQQFKEYNFPSLNKDPVKTEMYKNTYLKSDNISIRYPNLDKNTNINSLNENLNGLYYNTNSNNNDNNNFISHISSKSLNYDNNNNNYNLYSPNLNNYKDNKAGLVLNFKSKY